MPDSTNCSELGPYWHNVNVTTNRVSITMCRHDRGYDATDAINMVTRVYTLAGEPLPENLTTPNVRRGH